MASRKKNQKHRDSAVTQDAVSGRSAARSKAHAPRESARDFGRFDPAIITWSLIVILLTAFAMRIAHVGAISLWMDEYVHVNHAIAVLKGESPLFATDNNGILYTLFQLPLFALADPSAFLARLPSVFFGVGSIAMMWVLGRAWYNDSVGLIAAMLGTFSLYHTYWSRISRNYAIFAFFFLILVYFHWKLWGEPKGEKGASATRKDAASIVPHTILGIPSAHLGLFLLALGLSTLSHLLTYVSVFAIALHLIIVTLQDRAASGRWKPAYLLPAIPSALFLLLILTPALSEVTRFALSAILPPKAVDMVALNWAYLGQLWASDPWGGFTTYWDVLTYDARWLLIPGLAGFAIAFTFSRQAALMHLIFFGFPLLLMSFLFREPNLPRYLFHLYPLFLLAAAVSIHAAAHALHKRLPYALLANAIRRHMYLIFFALIITVLWTRWPEVHSLVMAKQRIGYIVDDRLSGWYITNWSDVFERVRPLVRDTDVIMSTVPMATEFYLKRDDVVWFRQTRYNAEAKRYEKNPETGGNLSADHLEDLKRTVSEQPRGWLFADYYLYNVMTDPMARWFVYRNLTHHPELSSGGDIVVFSWDVDAPPPQGQMIVVDMGPYRQASEPFQLTLNQIPSADDLPVRLLTLGIDGDQEAYVSWNGDQNLLPIPKGQSKEAGFQTILVPADLVRVGGNEIKFWYNPNTGEDPRLGFVVYDIQVGM